jgi:acetyl esterase
MIAAGASKGTAMALRGTTGRHRGWRIAAVVLVLVAAAAWAGFRFSPWPSVLAIRWVFDQGAAKASAALERHVPADVVARLDLAFDDDDPHARLDLYLPADVAGTDRALPAVVWIHGGGFVSGRKEDIGNYARILAARGYAVASVGYAIAPGGRWPTPSRQANAALGWLDRHAARHHIDRHRFVLAGDSAGAQIAAELANAITSPEHAQRLGLVPAIAPAQLAGTLLYCGPYDTALVDWDSDFAWFMRTVLWAYTGQRDVRDNADLDAFSVLRHVTPAFPPTFISVGNADPLRPHSLAMAEALRARGVRVETLFFPDDHAPPLAHEYQFDLDVEAGRTALERSVAFLRSLEAGAPAE